MRSIASVFILAAVVLSGAQVFAHCEIPCGIYGDAARFAAIQEDLTTIEKSMKLIGDLSTEPGKNMNQLVRWVNNKEQHADHVRHVVTQYFLAQRVKAPATDDQDSWKAYHTQLGLLHQMIQTAMRCKQTTDAGNVQKLRNLANQFQELYETK